MYRRNDHEAVLFSDVFDESHDFIAGSRIEPAGWLIEEDYLRRRHQLTGDSTQNC